MRELNPADSDAKAPVCAAKHMRRSLVALSAMEILCIMKRDARLPVVLLHQIKSFADAVNSLIEDILCLLVTRWEHDRRVRPSFLRPLLPLFVGGGAGFLEVDPEIYQT